MLSRRASQDRPPRHPFAWNAEEGGLTAVPTTRMEESLRKVSSRALQYERQLCALESQLAEHLGNFRAVDSRLQDSLSRVRHNEKRADRALDSHVPHIIKQLDRSAVHLKNLSEALPITHYQVRGIRRIYDSGHAKADILAAELTWLNISFYDRWWTIVFTSSSPVSWRWKAFMRVFFVLLLLIFSWILWITLRGVYRAHRERLVWGERLMS